MSPSAHIASQAREAPAPVLVMSLLITPLQTRPLPHRRAFDQIACHVRGGYCTSGDQRPPSRLLTFRAIQVLSPAGFFSPAVHGFSLICFNRSTSAAARYALRLPMNLWVFISRRLIHS